MKIAGLRSFVPQWSWQQWLLLITFVLFPLQTSIHFWPEWSYVLGRRIDYLSPTLFAFDLILLFWAIQGSKPTGRLLKNNPLSTSLLALMVIFSLITTSIFPITLYRLMRLTLTGLAFIGIKQVPEYRKLITWGLIGCVGWLVPLALAQVGTGGSLGGLLYIIGERPLFSFTPGIASWSLCIPTTTYCLDTIRAYTTFPHPNVLGGFCAIVILILIRAKLTKPFVVLGILLSTLLLLLSGSRSAALAVVLGASVSLRHWRWLPIGLLLIGIVLWSRGNTDPSQLERIRGVQHGLRVWQQHPWFGTGIGTYLTNIPTTTSVRSGDFLQPVHHVPLLFLTEVGIIGFALFSGFLYSLRRNFQHFALAITMVTLLFLDHYLYSLPHGERIVMLVILFMLK